MAVFNLDAALAGDPVLQGADKVTELIQLFTLQRGPTLMAVVRGKPYGFHLDGAPQDAAVGTPGLTMAPRRRTAWVNVYKQESGSLIAAAVPYTSEQAAKDAAAKSTMRLIATLPVEYEE